jgi:NAD(P)H dehydrogenase (quinone)
MSAARTTGPEELALAEVAAVLSAVTGRAVLHVPATVEEALVSRAFCRAPHWQVQAWVSIYTSLAAGEMAGVMAAVPDLTGHPARTLEQVLRARA